MVEVVNEQGKKEMKEDYFYEGACPKCKRDVYEYFVLAQLFIG